ncbi:hypothetical protein RND81_08G093500 [Saponaria officinalis]|uniref:Uncharacterized protein n=1 Tax=Saponaria officinalis TaxID=3572 RepID=A0AAW1J675_SAPOF
MDYLWPVAVRCVIYDDVGVREMYKIVFEDVFVARDAVSLEQLKELSAKRRVIDESVNDTSRITEATARKMSGGLTSRIQQEIQKLDNYIPLLQNLIIQVDSVTDNQCTNRWNSELKIRWTSILGSSPTLRLNGPKHFQINSLRYEVGMILFLYGLTLRDLLAFEVLQGWRLESGTQNCNVG